MNEQTKAPRGASPATPRFEHPKVLAIDLPVPAIEEIRVGGFNIESGSFGQPMRGRRSNLYEYVRVNARLPDVTEREIVVADLASPAPLEGIVPGEKPIGEAIWQPMVSGIVDPRPRAMELAKDYFDRALDNGGTFILFADARDDPGYVRGSEGAMMYAQAHHVDNWGLLSVLGSAVHVKTDWGSEITEVQKLDPSITVAIGVDCRFTCVFEPAHFVEERWLTLATNKYGKPVAGVLGPEPDSGQGFVFIMPRVRDKGALVRGLLDGLLPRIAPNLFPEDERQAWVESDTYAPAGVRELRERIHKVRSDAEEEVAELESEIERRRSDDIHLRALLTETGAPLVAAVKQTLQGLGLSDVRDVDETDGPIDGRLHEDLQIHRPSPLVVAEVKGVNRKPSDAEVLEVNKYMLRATRELKRHDINGLTIVNHQRSLPPEERDEKCFDDEQVRNAGDQGIGLITTWDLYRLARGYEANGWATEQVAALLTETAGRIELIPAHYARIGEVVNFFDKVGVIGVKLDEDAELRVGERIGLIGPVDYLEQEVRSMQVEDEAVEHAAAGVGVGVKTAFGKGQVREKMVVYRVGEAVAAPVVDEAAAEAAGS